MNVDTGEIVSGELMKALFEGKVNGDREAAKRFDQFTPIDDLEAAEAAERALAGRSSIMMDSSTDAVLQRYRARKLEEKKRREKIAKQSRRRNRR